MSEILRPPTLLNDGDTFQSEGDSVVFTENHSYRDILRYVIAELGDEAAFHVADILELANAPKDTPA
jgi:hypothetical protein